MYYQTDPKVSQLFWIGLLVHFPHFLSPHILFSFICFCTLIFFSFFFPFPLSFPSASLSPSFSPSLSPSFSPSLSPSFSPSLSLAVSFPALVFHSLIFFPCPKSLWFLSPPPLGDYKRIYTPEYGGALPSRKLSILHLKHLKKQKDFKIW